ncbi:hypothetical protein D9758_003143 [Tetrapyrgos nigripes]|uniref:RNA-binding protein n=1 Tax=Tetrapyrgos nigripes TaxID=182062 RepID=A0A8H5LQC9_9AGAR|nr:hypothetical protein D9758_003143 [Tetrapyrgos nigripes]
MAYNREWDRGKADSASYPNNYDDDYYSQGKRRKFNTGGYQVNDSYDDYAYDTSYQQGRPGQSQDYSQDRSRPGNLPKKRMQASEPSPHVIFLGLDPDFTEADLQAFLNSKGCSVETVTIIRERSTGSGPFGFGFAQFTSSEHARAFVDPLFPFIVVPPPASHGALAAQAFYKAVDAGAPHNGRRVKIDYSQSASPHEKGRFNNRGEKNEGTRDIGNSQAPVLLFRGLDPLSGPQAIHQAMKFSAGPGKEGAKGMKRIILIKDKVTMASFGFAFVEFIDIQPIPCHPRFIQTVFRISDRPVAASFANPESFKPIPEIMLRDEACLTSSLALGGVEGTWVRYWDDTSTVAVLEFQVAQPAQQQTTSGAEKEKKEKKKKDAAPRHSTPAAPSALPVSDKPVTLNFKQPNKQSTSAATIKPLVLGFASDDVSPGEGTTDEINDGSKASTSKKVAPLIASKKTVNNINKWNQVQEELSGASAVIPSTAQTPLNVSNTEPQIQRVQQDEDEFEFADINSLSCLLCARQFKSMDQLKRHNKESELHKARSHHSPWKNYKDANLREIARQKLQARHSGGVGNKGDQPKYRDRASERRILFNQPDAPTIETENGFEIGKKRQAEGPPPPARSATPPALNPGEDENNVGNKLLKMMGWKQGTGLGTSGEGRTEPIKTAIYAEGVGLGASKGKEIGSFTAASSGYLAMAQDSARERYQA